MNKSVLVTGSSRGIGLTLATSRFLFGIPREYAFFNFHNTRSAAVHSYFAYSFFS